MAQTFSYVARDPQGQVITGSIIAENDRAVAEFVRGKGYFVTKIKAQKEQLTVEGLLQKFRKISLKEMAVFCRQFATMMDAGLNLIACLNILIEQTYNPRLKNVLQNILKQVQEGQPMSAAMQNYPDVFPTIMIAMVESGEVGGVLDEVMERLAVQFEKDHKMNEKVKSAMTYPLVVVVMSICVVIFILTYILPTFIEMFKNMNMELPPLTKALLKTSEFLRSYGLFLIPALFVAYLGFKRSLNNEKMQLAVDHLRLRLPVFGLLWRKVAIARFTRTLSTLIRGGVPLILALEVVKKTTDNLSMTQALSQAQASVKEGMGLSAPLGASRLFTPMVVQMVAVGEETGDIDKLLEKIADFYDSEVEDTVARLSTMLEPLLIGFLGVTIGTIILAIMIPMFDVMTHIGQ